MDFNWLYVRSFSLYQFLTKLFRFFILDKKTCAIFFFILWLIGFLYLVYRLLRKISYYMFSISEASKDLLNKEVEYIELPPELRDLQQKMNHLKMESEKNERLARESENRKNDLIVYLAHDLKTPLTSMIGYLSLLEESPDLPSNQREKYIGIALEKSYRLEDLINELFEIARFNSETIVLEKETIDLSLMLEQLVDEFYPLLKENQKEVKLSLPERIELEADPSQLVRVFANLIKNAIYYSTDHTIVLKAFLKDNMAHVVIRNSAKKLSKEKIQKIFDKFYRVDTSRNTKTGGNGLGLAIAKEIVELHGGTISVTSDQFMTFTIDLPISS